MPAKKKAAAKEPEGPLKPHKTWGISRIEQESKSSLGYYVRAGGAPKWFSDKKHGGKKKALEAAMQERDARFEKLPPHRQARAAKKHAYSAKAL